MACSNGFYPIHVACKHSAVKSIRVIFDYVSDVEEASKRSVIDCYDGEGNTALHAAVNGGNVEIVEMCLKNGACICKQQHDKSTPLHLACSRGSLDIVKVLIGDQLQSVFEKCLNLEDADSRNPLHIAVIFNHADVASYLISMNANLEHKDTIECTPLLLSALHQSWDCLRLLMKHGADLCATDINKRNVFHLIVLNKGYIENFRSALSSQWSLVLKLLNEKDNDGCSPIHLATKSGVLKSVNCLITNGVDINIKNEDEQSPLHFAAKYGRYNTVEKLIDGNKKLFILNDSDKNGNSALHLAAENGQVRVISLLLSKGAALTRNNHHQSPLHLASIKGYTHSARVLLTVHGFTIDKQDRDGNTALHYAAINNKPSVVKLLLDLGCVIVKNNKGMNPIDYAIEHKNMEAIQAMIVHPTRKQDIMGTEIKNYESVYHALIESMPSVMKALLDNSISTSTGVKIDAIDYYVKYDFECLEGRGEGNEGPLPILNAMVRYNRAGLLSHNLCKQYLISKWIRYGMPATLLGLIIYFTFLFTLTVFVVTTIGSRNSNHRLPLQPTALLKNVSLECLSYVLWIEVAYNYIKEICQMMHQKLKYLKDPVNYIEVTLYVLTPIVIITSNDYREGDQSTFLMVSAITLFIAWLVSLLYLQRFNGVGLYIVMFFQILATLLKVMLIFSIIIIAFSFSFHVLLGDTHILGPEKGLFSVSLSFVRVMAMTLGELDFIGSFVKPFIKPSNEDKPQLGLAIVFFVLFGVLVPVLLMNLLIGLAVGDIEAVRRNAILKALAMQVDIHTDLEERLPTSLINRFSKKEYIHYPNLKKAKGFHARTFLRVVGSIMANSIFESEGESSSYNVGIQTMKEDLEKHRTKLKELINTVNCQYSLTKLIVQKMEIVTEQDDFDEGEREEDLIPPKYSV